MISILIVSLVAGLVIAIGFLINDSLPVKYPYLGFLGVTVFWPLGLVAAAIFGLGYFLFQTGREIGVLLGMVKS